MLAKSAIPTQTADNAAGAKFSLISLSEFCQHEARRQVDSYLRSIFSVIGLPAWASSSICEQYRGLYEMKKQAKAIQGLACVIARILLCSAFLGAILGYTNPDVHAVAQTLSSRLAVTPQGILAAVAVGMTVAILSIVLGYRARIGALVLLMFAALTMWLFQGFTFWNVVNGPARQDHMLHLVLNLSVMGAMLMICANGPGEMSFDARRR